MTALRIGACSCPTMCPTPPILPGGRSSMTDQAILNRMTQILRDLLSDDSIVLTMETKRDDVPDWDSFAYINFIVAVEGEFGVKFGVAEVESFPNVGAIVRRTSAILLAQSAARQGSDVAMVFNSYQFIFVFLPAVVAVFFAIGRFSRRLGAALGNRRILGLLCLVEAAQCIDYRAVGAD